MYDSPQAGQLVVPVVGLVSREMAAPFESLWWHAQVTAKGAPPPTSLRAIVALLQDLVELGQSRAGDVDDVGPGQGGESRTGQGARAPRHPPHCVLPHHETSAFPCSMSD